MAELIRQRQPAPSVRKTHPRDRHPTGQPVPFPAGCERPIRVVRFPGPAPHLLVLTEEPAVLRVLSSPKTLCDGITRRDLLQVGGLTFGGLSLPHLLSQGTAAAPENDHVVSSFGTAKQCLVLFLYGYYVLHAHA